jgi:hypothetical protein
MNFRLARPSSVPPIRTIGFIQNLSTVYAPDIKPAAFSPQTDVDYTPLLNFFAREKIQLFTFFQIFYTI